MQKVMNAYERCHVVTIYQHLTARDALLCTHACIDLHTGMHCFALKNRGMHTYMHWFAHILMRQNSHLFCMIVFTVPDDGPG